MSNVTKDLVTKCCHCWPEVKAVCVLPAGHSGVHSNGNGGSWLTEITGGYFAVPGSMAPVKPKVGEWYPAETAPLDGTYFIVCSTMGYELAHYYELEHEVYDPVGDGLFRKRKENYSTGFNVNHFEWWTPLPPLPEGASHE